jgi:hypothetical protein
MTALFSLAASRVPILSAPARPKQGLPLWPRLRLFVDRVEVTRWWGWRRVWRRMPLAELKQVQAPAPTTLRLKPADGPPLILNVKQARRWARLIRACRACLDPGDAP